MKIHDQADKTYTVLGGHRNGTSFMAHCLKEQGVKIDGDGNSHLEDIDFVKLNQKIIQQASGNWKNPPNREALKKSSNNHKQEFQQLIKNKKTDFWGWKDPRQALTMEHMVDVLEDDAYLVCVFRKPERVAKSLKNTDGILNGVELTKQYTRSIIRAVERFMGL